MKRTRARAALPPKWTASQVNQYWEIRAANGDVVVDALMDKHTSLRSAVRAAREYADGPEIKVPGNAGYDPRFDEDRELPGGDFIDWLVETRPDVWRVLRGEFFEMYDGNPKHDAVGELMDAAHAAAPLVYRAGGTEAERAGDRLLAALEAFEVPEPGDTQAELERAAVWIKAAAAWIKAAGECKSPEELHDFVTNNIEDILFDLTGEEE